jgi:hypothetical protein
MMPDRAYPFASWFRAIKGYFGDNGISSNRLRPLIIRSALL